MDAALVFVGFMALWYVVAWMLDRPKRRFRVRIVGTWRRKMDYLLLSGVGAKKASGKVVPLAQSEFTLQVAGPGLDVPVPDWAPSDTQAAVQITGDEGTIETLVTAAAYADAIPLSYVVVIKDPVTDIVGNWTRVAAPA